MKHIHTKKSALFLLEIMISILFFSLASAVCVRLFAKSYETAEQSRALHRAVIEAQNLAEVLRHTEDPLAGLSEVFPNGTITNECFTHVYEEHAKTYQAKVDIQYHNQMQTACITVVEADSRKEIYQLSIQKHLPLTLSAAGGVR